MKQISVTGSTPFKKAHDRWLQAHLSKRDGERKRRLEEGHGHAERKALELIWWAAFGTLDYLHPEYEIKDFHEGTRFIDLAYIRAGVKIALEIDGYGPHVKNLSRRQFCDQWVRQMHLINDGWIVIRIGYDDVIDRPRLWQQLLQQMLGKYFGDSRETADMSCEEREILRVALRLGRPMKIADVRNGLGCGYRYARKLITHLEKMQWLEAEGGGEDRVHSWRLTVENKKLPL